jgi:4-hydroxy-tetrahydrodipicolinate synthase
MNFSGIWVPLVTPFKDGKVDHAALRGLTRHFADAGVAGVVALGTTGEAAAQDTDEQLAVVDTVLDAARGMPVIVGLAGNHAGHVRDSLLRFIERPIAGLLTPAPYYIRPSQQGLISYFNQLADISSVPLVLYDIPYRTGVRFELDTLLALAAHPRIQAIKDCAGSLDITQALIADGRLQVLAGEDLNCFNTFCLGGSGAIAASAHIRPDLFVSMFQAVQEQNLLRARAIYHALAPFMRMMFTESNPAPVKAALALQGRLHNELRQPMLPASDGLIERLKLALPALERRVAEIPVH